MVMPPTVSVVVAIPYWVHADTFVDGRERVDRMVPLAPNVAMESGAAVPRASGATPSPTFSTAMLVNADARLTTTVKRVAASATRRDMVDDNGEGLYGVEVGG